MNRIWNFSLFISFFFFSAMATVESPRGCFKSHFEKCYLGTVGKTSRVHWGENDFFLMTNAKTWNGKNTLTEQESYNLNWTTYKGANAIFIQPVGRGQLAHRGTYHDNGSGCLIPCFYPYLTEESNLTAINPLSGQMEGPFPQWRGSDGNPSYEYSQEILDIVYSQYEYYKQNNSTEGEFGFQLIPYSEVGSVSELQKIPAQEIKLNDD